MGIRCFQAVIAVLVLVLLSSCTFSGRRPIDRPLYYDVRDVAVIADARVPQALIAGVDRRVADAIAVTRRPVVLPRVVLTVSVRDYGVGDFGDRRARATFRVVATSVDNGQDIAAGTFTVFSTTDNPSFIAESLAEEIAARVRFSFSLSTPPVVRPKKQRPPATSTQMIAPAASIGPAVQVPPPAVSQPAPEGPAEAPMPNAAPPAKVLPPVAGGAPAAPAGSNVEEGANARIKLSDGVPVCDPKEDPECQVPAP